MLMPDPSEVGSTHNHEAQPELYAKHQARAKLKESVTGQAGLPVSDAVMEVVSETNPEHWAVLGSVDALKQTARRFNKKLHGHVSNSKNRLNETNGDNIKIEANPLKFENMSQLYSSFSQVNGSIYSTRMTAEQRKQLKHWIGERLTRQPEISLEELQRWIREDCCFKDEEECAQKCCCKIKRSIIKRFIERNMEKFRETGSLKQREGCGRKRSSNVCDECGYVYTGLNTSVTKHKKRVHGEEIACTECGEMVKDLATHIRQKHKEKTFCCNFCGKSFSNKKYLTNHEAIHGEARAFPCRFLCGYASKTSGNRSIHEKRCHNRPNNSAAPAVDMIEGRADISNASSVVK